jgi:hypothetical protein
MITTDNKLYIAHGPNGPIVINGNMANRHGLVAGATGTGKTVTLQVLAETFSQAGVPCFMADMKGDLSGISQPGAMTKFIEKRCAEFGIENPAFGSCPVRFFDVYGEQGHPMRTTIERMGAQLIGRLLGLNETQTGVLIIVFRIAEEKGYHLIDLKDLRAMLDDVSKNAAQYTTTYGNIAPQSIGAIQRGLLSLESEGANLFFGEPDFDIFDLLQCIDGKGVLNVLAADRLMLNPKLYSSFLLWLLSELYAKLPEVGDMDKPKFVFFFDEAHMLFDGTAKALVDKIEMVVRLIRSKGVGVYFVTQNPTDVPDAILSQLGNRVQHALRAFTPKDQKAVKAASETFRANPDFKTIDAITELGTGEALVSFLDEKGTPAMVQRAKILFPLSQIGAISDEQRSAIIKSSQLYGKYETAVDRESAYEKLQKDNQPAQKPTAPATKAEEEKPAEKPAEKAQKTSGRKSKGFWSILLSILTPIIVSLVKSLGREVIKSATGKTTTRSTSTRSTSTRRKTTSSRKR